MVSLDTEFSFPVIALFAYPNAMLVKFLCGVLYNAGLWMAECIGIIRIYLNKKCLCLEIICY